MSRQRDPLLGNWRDARNGIHLNGVPLRSKKIEETPKKLKNRKRKAAATIADKQQRIRRSTGITDAIRESGVTLASTGASATAAREAVIYQYVHVYGAPPPDEWGKIAGGGLVNSILLALKRTLGSYTSVRDMLMEYCATGRTSKKRFVRKTLIQAGDRWSRVVLIHLAAGHSIADCTYQVNRQRMAANLEPVSWSTVQRFVASSPCVRKLRVIKVPQGKTDIRAPWSQARLLLVKNLIAAHERGQQLLRRHDIHGTRTADEGVKPLYLDGILFPDEKHTNVIAGCPAKFVYQVSTDQQGMFTPPSLGGVFPPRATTTVFKYDEQACFILGVAMKRVGEGGLLMGVKMKPYEYTGRVVVGVTAYDAAVQKVVEKLLNQKSKPHDLILVDGVSDFLRTAQQRVNKTLCSVKELIDHCIMEGNEIFADTVHRSSWLLYHDALSSWWEKGSVEYLKRIGMYDRCVRLSDDPQIPAMWRNRLPGDSPECSPCDSHAFASLEASMKKHIRLTHLMDNTDERKFLSATPAQIGRTLRRCWDICPTSEQIINDINHLPKAWNLIMEAQGAIVPELDNRRGRRARRRGIKKARKSQKKSTLIESVIHPDVAEWCRSQVEVISISDDSEAESIQYFEDVVDLEGKLNDYHFDIEL